MSFISVRKWHPDRPFTQQQRALPPKREPLRQPDRFHLICPLAWQYQQCGRGFTATHSSLESTAKI